MAKETTIDINDLIQDDKNFNSGTEEGQRLIEKSFEELGAGRSILIDRNGNIIAGNKSQQAAIKAGIKKVRVIETTGDELVAVKRTDIDLDSVEGRKLALADNSTASVNLSWDETQLQSVVDSLGMDFDVEEWGVDFTKIEEPMDIDMTDDEQKNRELGICCVIKFNNPHDLHLFTQKYQEILHNEYNATIMVHGGAL